MTGLGRPEPDGVADRLAITDVLHAYAAAIDAHDWAGAGQVFTTDALLDYTGSGGPVGSRTEAIDWIRDSLGPLGRIQHSLTNVVTRLDGDHATSSSLLLNMLQLQPGTEPGPGLLVGGRYEDRLRLTPQGWRIEARVQTTSWLSEAVVRATASGA